jgi:integrase
MPTWETVPLGKITFEGLTVWVSRLTSGGVGLVECPAGCPPHVRRARTRGPDWPRPSQPARGLALPRPRKRDHVFLTHEQLARLASAAGDSRLLVLVLGYTGLR